MVSSIVDDESSIVIKEEPSNDYTLYEVYVSEKDIGKLIGSQGRIAKSIRTLAKASGARDGVRVLLNIMNKPIGEE